MNTRRYPLRASAARASSAIGAQTSCETRSRSASPACGSSSRSKRASGRIRPPARKRQKTSNSKKGCIDDPEVDNAYVPTSEKDDDDSDAEPSESSIDEEIEPVRTPRAGSSRTRATRGRKALSKQSARKSSVKNSPDSKESVGEAGHKAATLNDHQIQMLNKFFMEFDLHENGRFNITDIRRVADDYGMDLTLEEAANMLRFWDKSGTQTISREAFTQLAVDSKFVSIADG